MRRQLLILASIITIGVSVAAKVQAQAQPDLIVRQATITKNANYYVDKITVAVTNACNGSTAGTSYVLVTFKESPGKDAKAIYYIGNTVKALKGGETYAQTFSVGERRIPYNKYIYVEVDPYKKVTEASEDNNWRTLNPSGAGVFLTQGQCTPKM